VTLLKDRGGRTLPDPAGSAGRDRDSAPASGELQTVRSGPEMDEARTAPIAIVAGDSSQPSPSVAVQQPPFLAIRNVLRAGVVQQAAGYLAVAGLIAAIATHDPTVALVTGIIAVLIPPVLPGRLRDLLRGLGPVGADTLPRVALAAVVVLAQPNGLGAAVSAVLAGSILLEPIISRTSNAAPPYASNLPGISAPNGGRVEPRRVYPLNAGLVLVTAIAAVAGVPAGALLVLAVLAVVATALVLVDAVRRVRARRRAEGELPGAVAAYAPAFALHWDAPPGTEYQVTMWLPYLQRIGEPFMIIVRNPKAFAGIASVTDVPVVVRQDPRDLDAVIAPSMRAVFYVNNAARNTHLIRFTGLTHVQLNHGESDKAPSYSPVFRLYDKDFVAGQAAIDRFAANGVHMPEELFTIVGRPQIEDIAVGTTTSKRLTALYAPTWGGANADSDYCSLPIGYRIVEALVKRGYAIIFRPHPYTRRNPQHARESDRIEAFLAAQQKATGVPHRFGAAATSELSLVDCFNASHLLVSDVSSVVPDFLYSEKPFAVVSMQGTPSEFARSFPIAKAAYVLDNHGRNIPYVLDSMTTNDPAASARRNAKRYFLGDFPADGYAEVFVNEARKLVVPA
jgi:hypothetical protein